MRFTLQCNSGLPSCSIQSSFGLVRCWWLERDFNASRSIWSTGRYQRDERGSASDLTAKQRVENLPKPTRTGTALAYHPHPHPRDPSTRLPSSRSPSFRGGSYRRKTGPRRSSRKAPSGVLRSDKSSLSRPDDSETYARFRAFLRDKHAQLGGSTRITLTGDTTADEAVFGEFATATRSYSDLPIRCAIDGSGKVRDADVESSVENEVRDEYYVLCRTQQIKDEATQQLRLICDIYKRLDLGRMGIILRLYSENCEGHAESWGYAEEQLRQALPTTDCKWLERPTESDNAIGSTGPKIGIRLQDVEGRHHLTAELRVDLVTPVKLGLGSGLAAKRAQNDDVKPVAFSDASDLTLQLEQTKKISSAKDGPNQKNLPALIRTSFFGHPAKFLQLIDQRYENKYPLWMSKRQVMVVSVSQGKETLAHVEKVLACLNGQGRSDDKDGARRVESMQVGVDKSAILYGRKVTEAQRAGYSHVLTVGPENAKNNSVGIRVFGHRKITAMRRLLADAVEVKADSIRKTTVLPVPALYSYFDRTLSEYL